MLNGHCLHWTTFKALLICWFVLRLIHRTFQHHSGAPMAVTSLIEYLIHWKVLEWKVMSKLTFKYTDKMRLQYGMERVLHRQQTQDCRHARVHPHWAVPVRRFSWSIAYTELYFASEPSTSDAHLWCSDESCPRPVPGPNLSCDAAIPGRGKDFGKWLNYRF
jgi:hypothetical protein